MAAKKRKTKGTADSVDVHVGKRLQLRRSLLGLSQEKLGEAVGLTFQQIQKYEKGLNRISSGKLFQFSKILDVPVQYFFDSLDSLGVAQNYGLSDNEQEHFIADDVMQRKETIELLKAYYSNPDESVRRSFIELMKATSKTKD
ncbi:MAG: helix-turn-helix transcriptional regulator [Alphaproteobacteria bacterium]|nr:helix-turn-helix transcriptional regulator [Alphaproteobacteria bacterium]